MNKKNAANKEIVIVGVGGAGNNTVNRLSKQNLEFARLLAVNTDKQQFKVLGDKVETVLIGKKLLKGKRHRWESYDGDEGSSSGLPIAQTTASRC